ncbi:hypothetical protein CIPAW_06G042700 [Carya illinoinensis]|uniref:Uncharacterized protein n=1 Tax=Carya illinoinensis TaxID=32201 RepID=A0A8T1Q7R0_CARIL|nr:hypothetical protein CIPAW_06G042700 [Carya illinoinensis]
MLTRAFGDIAEDASETEESCKRLMGQLAKLRLDHVRTGNRPFSGNDANHNYVDACAGMSCESTKDVRSKVYSPLVVRSKWRPPSKRKVSVVEKAVNKCKARKKKIQQSLSKASDATNIGGNLIQYLPSSQHPTVPWSQSSTNIGFHSTIYDDVNRISQDVDINIRWPHDSYDRQVDGLQ